MLYIVSTPIGNLQDISYRAVETLKKVNLIAAEDTRHTRLLMNHYGIETPLTSYFEHNKITKGDYLVRLLGEGKDIALVSDAGTPGISDPGYHLIRLAQSQSISMTVIPGPTALIAALSLSGLPCDRFVFEGFLPVKSVARQKRLAQFQGEERTIVFYESPHRIIKALEDIRDILGDPFLVVARELTKKFEETRKGLTSGLIEHFETHKPRGEFVLVLNSRKGFGSNPD